MLLVWLMIGFQNNRKSSRCSDWNGSIYGKQMENESVDTVVGMNGFHAFPDKQKAFHEMWRGLKPGGNFIACFYIRGKSKLELDETNNI